MHWHLQPKNALGKGLGLLIQSNNDSEKAETGETIRNRTDGFNALLLRQHHGDMDLVETVMYGHQLPIKYVYFFYVMQCFSRTKVLEF